MTTVQITTDASAVKCAFRALAPICRTRPLIRLTCDAGTLRIETQSSESYARIHIQCSGGSADLTCDANAIARVIRALPSGEVLISFGPSTITIAYPGASTVISAVATDGDGWHSVPDGAPYVSLPSASMFSADLTEMLTHASQDPTRHALRAVRLEVSQSSARMIATDGHRMLIRDIRADSTMAEVCLTIPADACEVIAALTKRADGDLAIEMNRDIYRVRQATWEVRAFAPGVFPDWRRVYPDKPAKAHAWQTASGDIARAVKSLTPVAKAMKRGNGLTIAVNGSCALSVTHTDAAPLHIPCEHTGPDFRFGVSAVYLAEAIRAMGASPKMPIAFRAVDDLSPIVVTCPDLPGTEAIIMPMRL